MRYQKKFRDIERERQRAEAVKNLKEGTLFVAGVLIFLIVLGLVGAVAR